MTITPITELPVNVYDYELKSADETVDHVFEDRQGKVTLLFNVAAGCGNVPQHSILKQLWERYEDEEDFDIIAIVVDDFECHGYEEFKGGLESYAERNDLDLTPGQVAEKYGKDTYGTPYRFTEITNGRYDKARYDPKWVPGEVHEQDMHPLWQYLTGAYNAEIGDNGIPHHLEESPWADPPTPIDHSKSGFTPLTGNFTKFLIDRQGNRIRRYGNGFLLGQRDETGAEWDNWDPDDIGPVGGWPSPGQIPGIELSLNMISEDIDKFLAEVV
jgi:glutathione peroxidase-family protein